MNETLAHTVILVAGILAYAAITIAGDDGLPVLTAVLGYGGAVGVSKATESK